jgi:hypothetical protein
LSAFIGELYGTSQVWTRQQRHSSEPSTEYFSQERRGEFVDGVQLGFE